MMLNWKLKSIGDFHRHVPFAVWEPKNDGIITFICETTLNTHQPQPYHHYDLLHWHSLSHVAAPLEKNYFGERKCQWGEHDFETEDKTEA